MSKPGLGRGLDRLMQAPAETPAAPDALAPGLRILVRGSDEPEAATETESATPPPQSSQKALRPFLIAALALADVALVLWPLLWLRQQHGTASWAAITGCAASVVCAAGAGVLAVVVWRKP